MTVSVFTPKGKGVDETVDSTSAYLQAAGRLPLLRRDEEEQLGIDLETARRLRQVERFLPPSLRPEDRPAAVGAALCHSIQETLSLLDGELPSPESVYAPSFRARIDAAMDPELVARVAERAGTSQELAVERLLYLSQDTRLLPPSVLLALHTGVSNPPGELRLEALLPHLLPLSAELAARWAEVRARGQRASDTLAERNLRLVVSIARRYVGPANSLLDVVQDGNEGLLKAVHRFDYRRGHKFSTYSVWWIRQAILRSLADRGRLIRLPVHRQEALAKVAHARQRYMGTEGDEPTAEQLAVESGLSVAQVEELLGDPSEILSLDLPLPDDETATLGDIVADPAWEDLEGRTLDTVMLREVRQALAVLPPRERLLIELRYGLRDGDPQTLSEVGRHLHISRERARQLEQRALGMLRRWPAMAMGRAS